MADVREMTLPETAGTRRNLVGLLARLPGPLVGLVVVLVFFIVLLGLKGQLANFVTLRNLQLLLHNTSVNAVVALGMLLIVISGGIDLSVGSVVALVTVVAMRVYTAMEKSSGPGLLTSLSAVAAGVATGAVCGALNGLAITRLKVTPFVVTLGMMSIARGVAVWAAERTRLSFTGERPAWVNALGRSRSDLFVFDPGVWSFLLLAVLVAVLLRRTVFGRYCYAVGSSEATARLCGINVERTRLAVYTLAGLLVGWAGILRFAHTTSGDPNTGVGLELEVIAAVVIGGASLSGGQGTVAGTLLGVLMLGVLENGVSFFEVAVEVKYILIGAVVIANTALSRWQRRRLG
jgi:ribose transport system permease protein